MWSMALQKLHCNVLLSNKKCLVNDCYHFTQYDLIFNLLKCISIWNRAPNLDSDCSEPSLQNHFFDFLRIVLEIKTF